MSNVVSYIFEIQDKMSKQLRDINKSMESMSKGTVREQEKIKKSIQGTNQELQNMRNSIKSVIASYIGFAAIKGVSNTLASFDTVLSGLRANVDNLSEEGFIQLKNRALELGATTEFTATQVGNGMVDLAKAGLKTNDILLATSDILNVATAAGVGFEQASSMIVGSVFALGRGMSDVALIGDLTAKAANISNASFNDIAMAIARGGSAAVEFNVNLQETYAAMATLTDSLSSGELAGSSFRAMLRELGVQSKAGAKALAQNGLTYDDINPKTNKLSDIIKKLQPLLKDTEAAFALLGDEGKRGAIILSANAQKFNEQTQALNNASGASKTMAQIMRDNLGGSINNLKSAIEELILKFGESGLTAGIRSVVDIMTTFIRIISNSDGVIKFAFALGKMIAQLWLINKAFIFMNGLTPFGWVRLAIVAVAFLIDNLDKLYEKLSFFRSIGDTLSKVFGGEFGGGLSENERIQMPQSRIQQSKQSNNLMEQIVNGKMQQSRADVNVNLRGELPRGMTAEVQTRSEGAGFINMGTNSSLAYL